MRSPLWASPQATGEHCVNSPLQARSYPKQGSLLKALAIAPFCTLRFTWLPSAHW